MQFKTLQTGLFIFLLAAATALFGWLISDYIMPIFWAVVLTILFYPLHQRLYNYTKGRAALSSLLTIGSILIIVMVPLYILGALVANEAISLYINLTQGDISSLTMLATIQNALVPLAQFGVDVESVQTNLVAFAQSFSAQIGTYALDIGRATAGTFISILLMLYILFFTLRDGKGILIRMMEALPLGDAKEKMLFERFVSIVHAMFKGTFIIAIVQGAIGGVLFMIVGIESAALWAFVMGLFALIPAVGPAIVWLPVGLLLLFTGSVWQGVTVLVVGATLVSLIDNLLRPVLVAKEAAMPDVLILLSVLGGLTLFGIAGIIIGPVITAFFLSMWQLFEHDYEKELKKFG
ncbi:AI-2E family transporter [Candidatus Kaiserbacteria bacterium]|nr:MAG: AI-2E family transporter [Candidatus Kaiserbacteria bacterium]